MSQQLGYMPQRQFHVLINMANEEHNLTVLPGREGNFRVMEKGEVLGEVDFTSQQKCVSKSGSIKKPIIDQLEAHIKNYYFLFKGLLT
jgi:hypothetical protein